MYKTLFGKEAAEEILTKIKEKITTLKIKPSIEIILVGENPASEVYVKNKIQKATDCGMIAHLTRFADSIGEKELLNYIQALNTEEKVDGILVQAPLPKHISYDLVLETLSPKKDVDGWTPINQGKLLVGLKNPEPFFPATPLGVMKLLEYYKINPANKHAVVVGRSSVVGKPLALLLLAADATVTICHSKTKNLFEFTKSADILVSAVGSPNLITADMVKEGAFVIDVGISRNPQTNKIIGDVDFENVIKKANCSPVPGGIGPLTIAMLMSNVLKAAQERKKSS